MENRVYPYLGWEFQLAVCRRCPDDFERSIISGC